jgi:tetrapyrrole methylase family protein/MazG family protein
MDEKEKTKTGSEFADLVEVMALLRSPQGCPWDREQDHRSLRRCLLEEAYEVLEAIDRDDPAALCQELGDLLLQVIFHAQLSAEAGEFAIGDVIRGLHEKLVVRHRHVFDGKTIETADAVVDEWESLKREQRQQTHADQMADVPQAMPALARAQMVLRRAARAGVARTAKQARETADKSAKLAAAGDDAEGNLAELLLAAVDLARIHGVDAEQALRERLDRFVAEFRAHVSGAATTDFRQQEIGSAEAN